MSFAVINGKVLDEHKKISVRNVLIQGDKITGVGYIPDEDEDTLDVCDVSQSMILPNTFDFLYAPEISNGLAYTKDIQSKGIRNIAYIPNEASTCLDTPEAIEKMKDLLGDVSSCVKFIACATRNNLCEDLSELSLLVKAGASAIYFGRIIENEDLFKQALNYVDMIGCPIVFGPMTMMEKNGTHLNDGATSFEIGIRGGF